MNTNLKIVNIIYFQMRTLHNKHKNILRSQLDTHNKEIINLQMEWEIFNNDCVKIVKDAIYAKSKTKDEIENNRKQIEQVQFQLEISQESNDFMERQLNIEQSKTQEALGTIRIYEQSMVDLETQCNELEQKVRLKSTEVSAMTADVKHFESTLCEMEIEAGEQLEHTMKIKQENSMLHLQIQRMNQDLTNTEIEITDKMYELQIENNTLNDNNRKLKLNNDYKRQELEKEVQVGKEIEIYRERVVEIAKSNGLIPDTNIKTVHINYEFERENNALVQTVEKLQEKLKKKQEILIKYAEKYKRLKTEYNTFVAATNELKDDVKHEMYKCVQEQI